MYDITSGMNLYINIAVYDICNENFYDKEILPGSIFPASRQHGFIQGHEQVIVRLQNTIFAVDRKIAKGIVRLNLAGYITKFSCEGDEKTTGNFGEAYISFETEAPPGMKEQHFINGGYAYHDCSFGKVVLFASSRNDDCVRKFRDMLNNWTF